MTAFNFSSYYLISKSSDRLIRYDIIKISDDCYVIKAFDLQQQGLAQPKVLLEIEEFRVTKQEWIDEYQIGSNSATKIHQAPSFESALLDKCQKHRNGIH